MTDVLFLTLSIAGVLALLIALQRYRRRQRQVTPAPMMQVITPSTSPTNRTWLWDSLTSRETQVARLVARGMRNADIARELNISVHTVESHLKHIYAKLDVHTRVELARLLRDLTD
ncbi:MAG: helix-turn-helix transcriptional regulator [Chloroflexi bacterium]|nr:helix-turn-helix transcriptional regulator [Chloroflexota bacterium]